MKLKLFTFSFNEATRTFDDNALQEFYLSVIQVSVLCLV